MSRIRRYADGIMAIGRIIAGLAANKSLKTSKIVLAIILGIVATSCSETKSTEQVNKVTPAYFCSGKYSHCYHLDSSCFGLSNCSGEVIRTALDSAVLRFDPCPYCVLKRGSNVKDSVVNTDTIRSISPTPLKHKDSKNTKPPVRDFMREDIF